MLRCSQKNRCAPSGLPFDTKEELEANKEKAHKKKSWCVLDVCKKRTALKNSYANWIAKHGLQRLSLEKWRKSHIQSHKEEQ